MNARQITIPEFALRVLLRPGDGDWLALVVPANDVQRARERLVDELTLRDRQVSALSDPLSAAFDR